MNPGSELDALELPDDLKALDAELSSIQYEERPSFGPELQAELAEEWARGPVPSTPRGRVFAAAAVVTLLLVGGGVPQARASLVGWIGSALTEEPVEAVTPPVSRTPSAMAAPIPADDRIVPEVEVPSPVPIPLERPEAPAARPERTDWPAPTLPEIEDRARAEALIREVYPLELQRAGVGGVVRLALWVNPDGSIDHVQTQSGSGVLELDRAAMAVAPRLRFVPATRRGQPEGTFVEFDVVFQTTEEESDPFALPAVDPVAEPEVNAPLDLDLVPEWQGEVFSVSPVQREAGDLLEDALEGDVVDRLGPVESILAGEPPSGVAPTQWRSEVGRALETALAREPDNPAPALALARLRLKQGLRNDARMLLERGLRRAMRVESGVSPSLFAELHYQRGALLRESWLANRTAGRVPSRALAVTACPQARSSGNSAEGFASTDRLIAWNYLCPAVTGEAFADDFQLDLDRAEADLAVMMASFRTAVEAQPDHVGANLEILLALSDEERWEEMYEGARRFVRASMGHPYGLLLGGLALQRLGRAEEARDQFELALRGLPENEVESLRDLTFLLAGDQDDGYKHSDVEQRRSFEERFWTPLDPILATDVNERAVEHLARSAYASLRFGSTDNDAAEVWIRYGRPSDVRSVGERVGLRTEFWDYGAGPDITFTRLGTSPEIDLTSEGREYLDDLREVFPHRYGSAARTVFTLPAQVSRFRAAEGTGWELEIHTEVPELLATGEADTLDVGVFMLDGEGKRVAAAQRRVAATPAPVTFRTPAAPNVRSVVVEVFNRTTHQAAALREVVAGDDEPDFLEMSDIMVVGATGDRGSVERDASWLEPLTLVSPLDADAVGVYFEVYNSGPEQPWYRVRAEVEDVDSGDITGVPIRPAGESGFRPTWDRYLTDDGSTREFFTLALSDVDPGRHVVRIVLDVPDAGRALMASRRLNRR